MKQESQLVTYTAGPVKSMVHYIMETVQNTCGLSKGPTTDKTHAVDF